MNRLMRSALVLLPVLVVGWMSPDTARSQQVTLDLSQELSQAREALSSPLLESAFSYVDGAEEETVQEWLSLCNAHAPSAAATRAAQNGYGTEIYRSRLISKLFLIYGLEKVHIDDALNVMGVRPGTGGGPAVVLTNHHDNIAVWPQDQPIEAFVADGRVWCPGGGDGLSGVIQILTILRAMNAADIETKGDVWFATFTSEEHGSPGAAQFVRSNYPHNIDWRNGDIILALHGGGGEGVTTGSTPYSFRSILRVFVPLGTDRWGTDAVDALAPIIQRINDEVRDPRVMDLQWKSPESAAETTPVLYLNMAMVQGNVVQNAMSHQAWIRFDLRSPDRERVMQAAGQIREIAREECARMGEDFTYHYEVLTEIGTDGIEGWNKVDNPPARMVAAAAQALYGTTPVIDSTSGSGDTRSAYTEGMPGMTLRGNVIDYGGGRFELSSGRTGLQSAVRRMSSGHSVTASGEIVRTWSGVKHALLFLAAYSGLAN